MLTKYEIITLIITLICIINSVQAEKFQFCAVDGRGHFKSAARYCPLLNKPDSRAQCVFGIDRLDCLRKISKNQADFAVFTSEDLVTASNSAIETLVTNELRFSEDKYEYQVVAVFDKKSGIKGRHYLQDKRFCHPGYGYESEWTRILSNYLEASVVPQTCQPDLTLTENRIKSSSEFFSSACKAGPWVDNSTLDSKLKFKYPNLCDACDNPKKCSTNDKYWGRRGLLFCLTDGAGDISWARWDDVQFHFGLVPGKAEASPEKYSLLCPDDTIRPVNTTNPCVWVVKPWSVVSTTRSKAQEIQAMISSLTHDDNNSWQSALLNLLQSYHLFIKPLSPVEPIESYLTKATGFLSANSFPGCHPPRTIRICTTSIVENNKCAWLREAMTSYGVEPGLECLKADNTTHCMDAVHKNFADVVIINPDLLNQARNTYHLKTLFYETVTDDNKYLTVAVSKKETGISSLEELQGKKACFPVYDGVAWNTVAYTLNKNHLLETCPKLRGMANFFGKSCVPGLAKNESSDSLIANCKDDKYNGEDGAIRCLLEDAGEIAFISRNNLKKFISDGMKNKNNLTLEDFKIICKEPLSEPCILSWAPIGHAMIRKNTSELWIKDTLDVFFAIDSLFGRNYKTLTTPFTLFGIFNGKSNLLFHDVTSRIRSQPTARNIDKMRDEYDQVILKDYECGSSSGTRRIFSFIHLSIIVYVLQILNEV